MAQLLDDASQESILDMIDPDISLELEKLAELFDEIDVDHSGSLNEEELLELFHHFGMDLEHHHAQEALSPRAGKLGNRGSVEEAKALASIFGDALEGDRTVTKAEFLTFMYHTSEAAKGFAAAEVTDFCFGKWDKDDSGEMTIEELQGGLSTLGESFSPSEVSQIIVALDQNDDGVFDKHEVPFSP